MSPSRDHEIVKKRLARLLEAYAEELNIDLEGYGSWTLKREKEKRGAEPDECYSIGPAGEVPDLAIEVVVSSGGLSKLEIYARIGVRELWFWTKDGFALYALAGDGDERIASSRLIPGLDFELLARYVVRPDQPEAVREYRDAIRASR